MTRAGLRCHRAPALGTRLGSRITRDRLTNHKKTQNRTKEEVHLLGESPRTGTNREGEPGVGERCAGEQRRTETRQEPQGGERSAEMLLPRLPVLSALLVLLLTAGRRNAAALLRGPGARADGRAEGLSMLELVGQYPRRAELLGGVKTPERDSRSQQGPDSLLRDPRHKEKFLNYLTGPLYFSPKCRRQFHRLYHNTRECTVPAHYKRCARLLTRLANGPRCAER